MYQFEKLKIWEHSVALIKMTYQIVDKFPKEERFSLSSQIQRAIVSVALNIAEGKGCQSDKEFAKFLFISPRSLHESVAGMKIAEELQYIKPSDLADFYNNSESLGAQIKSFIKKLKANSK
ncbi:MAG: four helix bundle protein [Patescibacteria group bacterium]|nr:four helix bundle protein [Patescibacteria group bacterium]